MKTQHLQVSLGRVLIVVLVLNGFLNLAPGHSPVRAQNRPVIINADQPNVWTLEQAHYLLAQMHRRNLDLKAKRLDDLDPNEINGLRFEVMKTLIELGVKFDQATAESNRLLSQNKNFNSERRPALIARRDQLQEESLTLTREIAQLQIEKARATAQEDKDRLDAEIAAKTSQRAVVDKQIESTNSELSTITPASGDFKSTDAEAEFDEDKLPKGVLEDAFKEAAAKQINEFNPQLNASLRLEKFLQMQYEIIAKQLTLLRDEVGPGERLLFLELPQTINVTHHEANQKWAQSWWRIVGYTRREETLVGKEARRNKNRQAGEDDSNTADASQDDSETGGKPRQLENEKPIKTSDDVNSMMKPYEYDMETGVRKVVERPKEQDKYVNKFIDLEESDPIAGLAIQKFLKDRKMVMTNRVVRTIDLIPRQSSLNVNDTKLQTQAGAFTAIASFLFGFGARLNVQRQREQFSQFVQQELYSSAFGKGSREFGWTFTPMPGTERLLSGVRTTYAVVVVPDNATSLLLETNGCYFPRSAYQPNNFDDTTDKKWNDDDRTSRNCNPTSKAFIVPVPVTDIKGSNDFYVSGLTYTPVDKGERIVVSLYGENFSAQTGVLVNGVALTHSLGLAQRLIRDDSRAGEEAAKEAEKDDIRGSIERVDASQIVATFKMPDDFDGTPVITLVAPGKALDINRLDDLYINGVRRSTLLPKHRRDCKKAPGPHCVNIADRMFNGDPAAPPFRIDSIEVFRNAGGRTMTALITGAGFKADQSLFINSAGPVGDVFVTASLIRAVFDAPLDEKIQAVLSAGDVTIKSKVIANPAFLSVTNVSVVSYEEASRRYPAMLVVKLEGSGFTDWLLPSVGRLVVKSPTEAYLSIVNPAPTASLILTDRRTGAEVRTLIVRTPPK